jgi:hypothetical protein
VLAGHARWPDEPALNLAQPDETTLREFLDGGGSPGSRLGSCR